MWLDDLLNEKLIGQPEYDLVSHWHRRWEEILLEVDSAERRRLKADITKFCELVAWQEWDKLHEFLSDRSTA